MGGSASKNETRLTVSVLLLSGLGVDDIEITVCSDGEAFEIKATWPEALLVPETLLDPFIKGSDYPNDTIDHAELLALETSLKNFRTEINAKLSEPINSICRVQLPFPVESNEVESIVLPTKSSKPKTPHAYVLLVRFFALEEEYYDSNSSKKPKLLSVKE